MWAQVQGGQRQADTEQQNRVIAKQSQRLAKQTRVLAKQARANCVVVSVLLINRSDRDATIKLFDPIRRENPKQFDRLVKRAEQGDKRLEMVQGDLACDVPGPATKSGPPMPDVTLDGDRSRKTDR